MLTNKLFQVPVLIAVFTALMFLHEAGNVVVYSFLGNRHMSLREFVNTNNDCPEAHSLCTNCSVRTIIVEKKVETLNTTTVFQNEHRLPITKKLIEHPVQILIEDFLHLFYGGNVVRMVTLK